MRVIVIEARVPKLRCETCDRYPQIPVPWARLCVSYTKMLKREFFILLNDSMNRIAELCRIRPCVAWNIVMYRVNQTLDSIDVSSMELLYINKTSFKNGYNYVTVVCDQDRLIIFICEGKKSETMNRLAVWLEEHNGKRDNIEFISCNLKEAYPSEVRCNFPNVRIVSTSFMLCSSSLRPWTTQSAWL